MYPLGAFFFKNDKNDIFIMPTTKNEEPTLTHNGKTYNVSELPEAAQKQLMNVKIADSEIRRLQMQLAIAQTAHNAYQQALIEILPVE
jgi:Family of unknown function (DUF6447)